MTNENYLSQHFCCLSLQKLSSTLCNKEIEVGCFAEEIQSLKKNYVDNPLEQIW